MKLRTFIFATLIFAIVRCGYSQPSAQLGAFDFLPQVVYANPALRPTARVNIAFPALGQVHFNHGNNFFVPEKYIETTPLGNTRINPGRIFSEMGKTAFVRQEIDFELFHLGIRIKKHYGYLAVRERIQFGVDLPVDLFKLLVYGNMNGEMFDNYTADLSGLGVNAMHFREYILGYNFNLSDKWQFGATAKYLYGMENIHSTKSNIKLATDPLTYDLTLTGGMEVKTSGLVDKDGTRIHDDIKSYLLNLNNRGMSMSLGATYRPIKNLQVEFSAHDIGYIKWQDHIANYGAKNAGFKFSGVDLTDFIFVKGEEFGDAFDQKTDSLLTAFKEIYELNESDESYTTFLNGYLRYGASYRLLNSEKFAGKAWMNVYHGISGNYIPFTISMGYTQNLLRILQAGVHFSKVHQLPLNLGFGGALNAGPIQFHLLVENINLVRFYRIKIIDDDLNSTSFPYFKDPRQLHFHFGMNITVGKKPKKTREAKPLKR